MFLSVLTYVGNGTVLGNRERGFLLFEPLYIGLFIFLCLIFGTLPCVTASLSVDFLSILPLSLVASLSLCLPPPSLLSTAQSWNIQSYTISKIIVYVVDLISSAPLFGNLFRIE